MPQSAQLATGVLKFIADVQPFIQGARQAAAGLNQLNASTQKSAAQIMRVNAAMGESEANQESFRAKAAKFGAALSSHVVGNLATTSRGLGQFSRFADVAGLRLNILGGAMGVTRTAFFKTGVAIAATGRTVKAFSSAAAASARSVHNTFHFLADQGRQIEILSRAIAQHWRPALLGLAGAVGTLSVEAVRASERFANLDARLRLLTGTGDQFRRSQDEIFRLARNTATELSAVYTLYIDVFDALKSGGRDVNETQKLVSALGRTFRISGTDAQEQARGIRQFLQAIRSDPLLRAQEFDTIAETNPRLIRLLRSEFSPELRQSGAGLRRLVTDGLVPMQRVTTALIAALPTLTRESATMGATLSASFTRLRNAYTAALIEIGRDSGLLESVRALAATAANIAASDNFKTFLIDIGKSLVSIAAAAAKVAAAFLEWYSRDPERARQVITQIVIGTILLAEVYTRMIALIGPLFRLVVVWKLLGGPIVAALLPFLAVLKLLVGTMGAGLARMVGWNKTAKAMQAGVGGLTRELRGLVRWASAGSAALGAFRHPIRAMKNLARSAGAVVNVLRQIARHALAVGRVLITALGVPAIVAFSKFVGIIAGVYIALESLYTAIRRFDGLFPILWGFLRIFLARVLAYVQEIILAIIEAVIGLTSFLFRSVYDIAAFIVGAGWRVIRFFTWDVWIYGWRAAIGRAMGGLGDYFKNVFANFITESGAFASSLAGRNRINFAALFGLEPEALQSPVLGAIRNLKDSIGNALKGERGTFDFWGFFDFESRRYLPDPRQFNLQPPVVYPVQPAVDAAWLVELRKQLKTAEDELAQAFGAFGRRGLSPYARAFREIIDAEAAARQSLIAQRLATARASKAILASITSALNDGTSALASLQKRVDTERIRAQFAASIAAASGAAKRALEAQRDAQIFGLGEIATAEENLRHARETGNAQLITEAQTALATAKANVAQYQRLTQRLLDYRAAIEKASTATNNLAQYEKDAAVGVYEARTKGLADYAAAVAEAAQRAREAQRRMIDEFAAPFTNFLENVLTLTQSISAAFRSLARDIARLVVQQTISRPVANYISDFLTNLLRPGGGNAFGRGGGGAGNIWRPGDGGGDLGPLLTKAAVPPVIVVEGAMNGETAQRLNDIEDGLGDAVQYAMEYNQVRQSA